MKAMKGNGNKMWRVFFVFGLALVLLASRGALTSAQEKVKPKYGGILRMWLKRDATTNDPNRWRGATVYSPATLVFSNLVRCSMQDLTAVEPDLAKSWAISADGKVYTFHLFENVKWHDGKPFSAEDVKYSLEKMTDPKKGVETARLFPNFERAEVVDKNTVKVYLSEPQGSFLPFLTIAHCKVQSKHIAEAGTHHQSPGWLVGTGPFKLKNYNKGISWEVERYADYHREGLPYLDGIAAYFMEDVEAQKSSLIAKRVDMSAPGSAYRAIQDIEAIRASDPKIVFQPCIFGQGWGVLLNLKNPAAPWQDQRVRKAISLVVDQKEQIMAVQGSELFAAPGGYLYPFGSYALPAKELARYQGTDKPYEERVAEAKRLMAAAGFSQGFEAVLLCRAQDPRHTRSAQMLAEQVRRIGITLKIDEREEATYLKQRGDGKFEWVLDSIESTVGDPQEQLLPFHTGEYLNYAGYSNPKFDELFVRSSQVTGAERVKVVQEAARELWKDLPFVVFEYYGYVIGLQPYVKDFNNPGVLPLDWGLFDQVWLDK
ncbi:MAG: ABC transporter substrate-binding protein [Deltaproteobacteria bacterium]|nr:MAG: ABC transporter substrate-binding protein [Deltaproteobacteria bacterium]